MKKFVFLLGSVFVLLSSACTSNNGKVDQQYIKQAEVLLENYNWYFGPYSEFKAVIGSDTEFRVYLNSENTTCIFITNEKIMTPDGSMKHETCNI